jgi:hypothetical protein
MRIVSVLCFTVLAIGAAPRAVEEVAILFIGNSLTSVNDVPALVRKLAESDGRKVRVFSVTTNDFGLEEHWRDGRAAREIARRRPKFVVLQQGPSAMPESRVMLRDYAARFDKLTKDVGGRSGLYMVWPARQRAGDFDGVSESYAAAARDVGGVFLPAGDAWRAAWARQPRLELLGADGFHPSEQGSWLAALVIYCGLFERNPADIERLPRGFPKPANVFVQSAAAALAR